MRGVALPELPGVALDAADDDVVVLEAGPPAEGAVPENPQVHDDSVGGESDGLLGQRPLRLARSGCGTRAPLSPVTIRWLLIPCDVSLHPTLH